MYNEYEIYAMIANDEKTFAQNKIHADFDILDKISEYKEVEEFVAKNYGKFDEDNKIALLFPQDIKLLVEKKENAIEIIAIQGEYLIFNKGWKYIKKESE